MGIALHPFIVFLKNLAFLLFQWNVQLLRKGVLKKWKNSKCTISDLLRDISGCRRHVWDKESIILVNKLDKFPSKKKKILNFYWDRDMAGKSIKDNAYKKNKFEKTRNYLKLNFKYPEFSIGLLMGTSCQMWI